MSYSSAVVEIGRAWLEVKFRDWAALREFCATRDTYREPLYYHAPLDVHAVRVAVVRLYKNGKVAVEPTSSTPTFKADPGHLERFSLRFWAATELGSAAEARVKWGVFANRREAEAAARAAFDRGWDVKASCSALGWWLEAQASSGGAPLYARTALDLEKLIAGGEVAQLPTGRGVMS